MLLGPTFLRFRANLPTAIGSAADLLAPGAALGMETLLPALAREFAAFVEIARSMVPVLISGETGTGKGVLAGALHSLSAREGAFVGVHCAALPASLIESSLFGHKRGAFSGAISDEVGLLRSADRGTVLLDELGELPLGAQVMLLRVLQESEVVPVGASRPVKIDVRVVAATHRDLNELVREGMFREDLIARITGFICRLPPLRERIEDLGHIIAALLRRISGERAASVTFSPDAAS